MPKQPPEPVAVLCADLHLDVHAWANRKNVRGDSEYAFSQIVAFATKKNLPIIAAGDLVDRKSNRAEVAQILFRELTRLREADLCFYYIQGQHDLLETPWPSAVSENTHWLTARAGCYEVNGVEVHGFDWLPSQKLEARLNDVPLQTQLLVLHQVCHQFMGDITCPELDLRSCPVASRVLVGDYHERRVLPLENREGSPMTVISPGATNLRSIAEPEDHWAAVLYSDLSCKWRKLVSRPVLRAEQLLPGELSDEQLHQIGKDYAAARDAAIALGAPDHIATPLLRFEFDADTPNVSEALRSELGDEANDFIFLKARKCASDSADTGFSAGGLTALNDANSSRSRLLVALREEIDPDEDPDAYGVCESLLHADSPQQALTAARVAYGVDGSAPTKQFRGSWLDESEEEEEEGEEEDAT